MTQPSAKSKWRARHAFARRARTVLSGLSERSTLYMLLSCTVPMLVPAALHAQALPAATSDPVSTGFELPKAAGSLSYSMSAFETFSTGFYTNSGGLATGSGLAGNLALITSSRSDPFSLIMSGGKTWSTSAGQPSPIFLNFAASQVLNLHKWNAVFTDSFAYLPATPSTGLSGIPGTGDLGIPPIQSGYYEGQGLLTAYSTRISNNASVSIGRRLSARTSANAMGSYSTLKFVGDSSGGGLDTASYSGGGGLSYALNARNNLSGNYSYTTSSYTGNIAGFSSQTASVGYSHQFSRLLGGDIYAGPQWTTISSQGVQLYPEEAGFSGTAVNLFLSADLNYGGKSATYSLGYAHGTNNGYGVTPGGRSDSLHLSASKTYARVWNLALTTAYTRTTSITGNLAFAPSTFIGGLQASRSLGRNFSAYGSYTLEKQSTTGTSVGVFDLFSGSFQIASFGLTYSPRPLRFGPR